MVHRLGKAQRWIDIWDVPSATTHPVAARFVKRGIDLAGAAVGLLLLSPVLACIALAILVAEGRPVFFRHVRPGRGARLFTLLKFRTMRPLLPGEPLYSMDAQRVTRLGGFL